MSTDHSVPVKNTVEGVVPSNDIANIGPSCKSCNNSKSNMPLFDFNPNYLEVRAQMLMEEGLEEHCVVQLYKLWQENLIKVS